MDVGTSPQLFVHAERLVSLQQATHIALRVIQVAETQRLGQAGIDAGRRGFGVYPRRQPLGQPGIDPLTGQVAGDTFEAQARQAFANLSAVLEDGGASLASVIKVTCFVADPSAFATLNDLFKEFFPVAPPVRSTPVVALPRGLLFSIDAVAVVARSGGS